MMPEAILRLPIKRRLETEKNIIFWSRHNHRNYFANMPGAVINHRSCAYYFLFPELTQIFRRKA